MLPCTSSASRTAALPLPCSCARPGAKPARSASVPWPTSHTGPDDRVESLKRLLRGDRLVSPQDVFAVERSLPHRPRRGRPRQHSEAGARQPDRLQALARAGAGRGHDRCGAERLITPSSKLATTRLWNDSTLAEELAVGDARTSKSCTRGSTGYWRASIGSRPSSRRVTSRTGPWCSTTPPPATTRGEAARSLVVATTARGAPAPQLQDAAGRACQPLPQHLPREHGPAQHLHHHHRPHSTTGTGTLAIFRC